MPIEAERTSSAEGEGARPIWIGIGSCVTMCHSGTVMLCPIGSATALSVVV
jgi:hypothetical protein